MKTLFAQELRLSLRGGGRFGMALVLYFAIGFLVSLGLGPDRFAHQLIAPSVLWVGALLSSLLTLDSLLFRDHQDGTIERLILTPLPTENIIMVKVFAHWILVCLPLCIAAPLVGLIMNLELKSGAIAAFTLLIGTPAISAIGIFVAALTLGMRQGHLLQAILIIPACIPTLIFGSIGAAQLMTTTPSPERPLATLAAISLATIGLTPFASSFLLHLNARH